MEIEFSLKLKIEPLKCKLLPSPIEHRLAVVSWIARFEYPEESECSRHRSPRLILASLLADRRRILREWRSLRSRRPRNSNILLLKNTTKEFTYTYRVPCIRHTGRKSFLLRALRFSYFKISLILTERKHTLWKQFQQKLLETVKSMKSFLQSENYLNNIAGINICYNISNLKDM